jgi:hypothetical protein
VVNPGKAGLTNGQYSDVKPGNLKKGGFTGKMLTYQIFSLCYVGFIFLADAWALQSRFPGADGRRG